MCGVVGVERNNVIKTKDKEITELTKTIGKYEEWSKIKDDKIIELENELENYIKKVKDYESSKMSIPKIDSSKKTYMDYCCISRTSKQGKIVYSSEAWTDEEGLRRIGEYYCVALGSYYGSVGDKFLVETDKGNKYKVIKADVKADIHTDSTNKYTIATGCMMEWIVETNKLNSFVRKSGNINNVEKVSGSILTIIKIKE